MASEFAAVADVALLAEKGSAIASFATPCVTPGSNPTEWITCDPGAKLEADHPVTGAIRAGEQKKPDQTCL